MSKKTKKGNGNLPANPKRPPWAGSGFYSTLELSGIDRRTRVARGYRMIIEQLRAYCAEKSVAAELLIQRIAYKTIKLALYEAACLNDPVNTEAPHYLPMANSLRIDMQALREMTGKDEEPDLAAYLASLGGKDTSTNGGK